MDMGTEEGERLVSEGAQFAGIGNDAKLQEPD